LVFPNQRQLEFPLFDRSAMSMRGVAVGICSEAAPLSIAWLAADYHLADPIVQVLPGGNCLVTGAQRATLSSGMQSPQG
jgi:hypothetical protein